MLRRNPAPNKRTRVACNDVPSQRPLNRAVVVPRAQAGLRLAVRPYPKPPASAHGGRKGVARHQRCVSAVLIRLRVAGCDAAPRAWAAVRGHRRRPGATTQAGWPHTDSRQWVAKRRSLHKVLRQKANSQVGRPGSRLAREAVNGHGEGMIERPLAAQSSLIPRSTASLTHTGTSRAQSARVSARFFGLLGMAKASRKAAALAVSAPSTTT